MSIPLQYEAPGYLEELDAFNARRKTQGSIVITTDWGGDFLFRIYPTPQRIFFIKIDSGTNRDLLFLFGALGKLMHKWFLKDKEKAKAEARVASYAGQRPALLLGQDSKNFVLQRREMRQPTIERKGKFGRLRFREGKRNKLRTFSFEDVANFQAGIERCARCLGRN